jgi:3-hydroxyacyl-[acyl-carrier-protein] dehydratase
VSSGTVQADWLQAPDQVEVAAPLRAVEQWRHEPEDGSQSEPVRLTARVGVHGDDPNLRGHFPGLAIFPGIFILESLCQLMARAFATPDGSLPVLRTLRSVRFLAPLLDGDELSLQASVTPTADGWSVKAVGSRLDGTVAARIKADFAAGEGRDA